MRAVLWAALLLSVSALAGVCFFVDRAMLDYAPWLFADLLAAPVLAVVLSAVLLWVPRPAGRGGAAFFAFLLAVVYFLDDWMLRDYADPLASAAMMREWQGLRFSLPRTLIWAGVLFGVLRLVFRGRRLELCSFVSGAFAVGFAAAFGLAAGPRLNKYGLASFPPNSVIVEDSALMRRSDDFPTVTNRYNSLGYRDSEPGPPTPSRTRILLVGNALVSGRGIASNDDTLGALLRRALEAKKPQRYEVVSAAYPSYSLYGDVRAVKALAGELQPGIVVVAYSFLYDQSPLDSQAIMDMSPANAFLRRIVAVLRLRSYVHVTARRHFNSQDPDAQVRLVSSVQKLLAELEEFTASRGIRLVFLHYSAKEPPGREMLFSPDVLHVRLPEELELVKRDAKNEFWYPEDGHPKAALNRKLAGMLADALVSAKGSSR